MTKKQNTQIKKTETTYALFKKMCALNGVSAITDDFLEQICLKLMEWSERPDALRLTQFLCDEGIPERVFYRWRAKSAELKEAHWFAMSKLATRREIGALTKVFDAGTVHNTLSQYCSVALSAENRRAKLKETSKNDTLEDLTDCLHELVEQKWNNNEDDSGTGTETPKV